MSGQAESQSTLSLTIRAVDKATAHLRAINEQIERATAPARKLGNSLHALGEESGLFKLGESFKNVGEKAREVGKSAFELGEKLLTMEAVGAFALFELAKGAAEAGSELKQNAARVGLTVDEYASLSFAAKQAHVSQEEFTSAMDKFNKNLGLVKANSGPIVEFLTKVNPALLKNVKSAHNTKEALELMINAFEREKDPAKRAALAQELFGRSSKNLSNFLHQGVKEIAGTANEYLELAGSQEKFAENGEELEKGINKAEAAFMGLRNAAAAELAPALTQVAETIAQLLADQRGNLSKWATEAGTAISEWVKGGGLQRLVEALKDLTKGLGTAVDMLGGLKGAAIAAGAVLAGPLLSAVSGLGLALGGAGTKLIGFLGAPVAAIFTGWVEAFMLGNGALSSLGLTLAANPLGVFLIAAAAVAAAGYEIYKNWGDLKLIFSEFWDSLKETFKAGWDAVKPVIDKLGGFIEIIKNPIAAVGKLGAMAVEHVFSTADTRPQLPVNAPGAPGSRGEVTVKVDLAGLPKGTRVTQDRKGDVAFDLTRGPAMGVP
jgi:hypothetical protein